MTLGYEAPLTCMMYSLGLNNTHRYPLSFVLRSFNFGKDYRQSGSRQIWTTSLLRISHNPHFVSGMFSLFSLLPTLPLPNLFVPLLVLWAVRCICVSAVTHPSGGPTEDAHSVPLYLLWMTRGLFSLSLSLPLFTPCEGLMVCVMIGSACCPAL